MTAMTSAADIVGASTALHPGRDDAPFVVERLRLDSKPGGYFTPGARLVVTPALRTSGLLVSLPGEEIKSLLLLLTFFTPNGQVRPSLPEIADALGVNQKKARERMARLQTFVWRGAPLVRCQQAHDELGLDRYVPAPHILHTREAPPEPEEDTGGGVSFHPLSRDAVIEHSRASYARPRAEVEAMIAEQMGWKEHGDSPEAQVRRRLLGIGVSREQADLLLSKHNVEEVNRQLDWMPYRKAKSPARFLVAAVEGSYDPPASVRWGLTPTDEDAAELAALSPEEGTKAGDISRQGEDRAASDLPPLQGSL